MILDDGVTSIEFHPTACELRVEDFTRLHYGRTGDVIAATNGGQAPRRTRRLTLLRTTAERGTLKTWFTANEGAAILFTDEVGRVWDAMWLKDFTYRETGYVAVGWHLVEVELYLSGVNSDAGREAYSNVDAGAMSIQKSGGALLYFPVAFVHPLDRTDVATAHKTEAPAFVAVDTARYTARHRLAVNFTGLPRAFVSELEDYLVTTLVGAANPFTLVHFRDGSTVYRWLDGLSLSLDEHFRWSGSINLAEEI